MQRHDRTEYMRIGCSVVCGLSIYIYTVYKFALNQSSSPSNAPGNPVWQSTSLRFSISKSGFVRCCTVQSQVELARQFETACDILTCNPSPSAKKHPVAMSPGVRRLEELISELSAWLRCRIHRSYCPQPGPQKLRVNSWCNLPGHPCKHWGSRWVQLLADVDPSDCWKHGTTNSTSGILQPSASWPCILVSTINLNVQEHLVSQQVCPIDIHISQSLVIRIHTHDVASCWQASVQSLPFFASCVWSLGGSIQLPFEGDEVLEVDWGHTRIH